MLKFIQLISERPLAGIEVVECSPPYDNGDITSLIATRVICDTLGCQVRAGRLPRKFTARPRIAYIAADSMPPATPSRPEE